MPTYEYKCDACGHAFEKFQPITSDPVKKCPVCGKNKVRRLISAGGGLIFKGSGFYITDYRDNGYKDSAKADTADGGASKTEASGGEKSATNDSAKPAETKKTESKLTESKSTESKSVERKSSESKPATKAEAPSKTKSKSPK